MVRLGQLCQLAATAQKSLPQKPQRVSRALRGHGKAIVHVQELRDDHDEPAADDHESL
jgi:hypothetical protein